MLEKRNIQKKGEQKHFILPFVEHKLSKVQSGENKNKTQLWGKVGLTKGKVLDFFF